MAVLSYSNNATMSLSQIQSWISGVGASGAPGATNISLFALEQCFMGNNTTGGPNVIVTNSKTCMWQQDEVYYNGNIYAFPPSTSPRAWEYNGPGAAYSPSRVSEFQKSYSPPPSCNANGQATGQKNSHGNIVLTFAGGSPAVGMGSSYYVFVDFGVNMGSANYVVGAWTGGYGSTTTFTDVANGAYFTGWVVDDKFCGGQMVGSEIRIGGTRSYP